MLDDPGDLDPPLAAIAQQKAQLQQAIAQKVEAEASVERARTLIKTGATSQEVLDQRERASGLEALVSDVISKPFSVAEIKFAVAAALAKGKR